MENERRYDVFHRTWWRWEQTSTGRKRVPGAGKRTYIAQGLSYELAREVAREWNAEHEPGELSRKAELEQA